MEAKLALNSKYLSRENEYYDDGQSVRRGRLQNSISSQSVPELRVRISTSQLKVLHASPPPISKGLCVIFIDRFGIFYVRFRRTCRTHRDEFFIRTTMIIFMFVK